MTNSECEVCGGQGQINLPVFAKLTPVVPDGLEPEGTYGPKYRTYPCPECSRNVETDKVLILQAEQSLTDYEVEGAAPDLMAYVKKNIAHQMIEMLRQDYITFSERREPGPQIVGDIIRIRGKLGVLSPSSVKKFEDQVKERQQEAMVKIAKAFQDKLIGRHTFILDGEQFYRSWLVLHLFREACSEIMKEAEIG